MPEGEWELASGDIAARHQTQRCHIAQLITGTASERNLVAMQFFTSPARPPGNSRISRVWLEAASMKAAHSVILSTTV